MTSPQRNVLRFECDPSEAVYGDQYLTPVYFNRQVLTRYLYDSRFTCDFASETYGTVYGPDFDISFGINRNGTVIVWLGDLQERIPVRERFYWLVENKQPEGDPGSEFFDAQIHAHFTPPPAIVQCLNALARLNAMFHKSYAVHLYRDRSIEERIDETRRYKRLVLNNLDDFKRFVSELNEIINENTNNPGLRRLLAAKGVSVQSNSQGNKLLELVYRHYLSDTENLIAPFFYLYDLRLWATHSTGDKRLHDVANHLGEAPTDYQRLLESLIGAMRASAEGLIAKLPG
jgi:hypothetical protein